MIGEKIRIRREELKLSQSRLAEVARVTPAAISQIESGKRMPSTRVLQKISTALKISPQYLLSEKELPNLEDILEDEEVQAHFREYKVLSREDKITIAEHIKFLKSKSTEEKKSE